MADLGIDLDVLVEPPAGPTFEVAPPAAPSVLVVPIAGAQGAQGPPGEDTSTNVGERAFTSAATVWEWDHGFGYTPSVTVMLSNRRQIRATVSYNDETRTVVEFYFPTAGVMALS